LEPLEGDVDAAAPTPPVKNKSRLEIVMIEIEDITKTYRIGDETIHALDQVSLTVEDGALVAVTGSSGSGKSTLLNILGCLDRSDSGRYVLATEDVSQLPDNRLAEIRNKHIGFIFQTFNLLPRMTALENVELPLLYAGYSDAKQLAKNALQTVGLADRIHHEPNQLSGGQRQRVAIARAIVTHPDIILADEPTGNLDSATSEEILSLLIELNEQGRTILIVTHEPDIAKRCPKEISMRDGRIVDIQLNH